MGCRRWVREAAVRWSAGENAELVTFRVGEHDPGHVALADVGAAGAEVEEPLHLVFLVVGVEVEMQSVLMGFGVVLAHEQQRRNAIVGSFGASSATSSWLA
jgi:hypothetical protein